MARRACASPELEAGKLVAETFKHYNFFWQIRTHYLREKLPYFQLTAKAHSCLHAALMSRSLNPRQGFQESFEGGVSSFKLLKDLTKGSDRLSKD